MADPQTKQQTNWIEYAAGRRWDPTTGQVQYNQGGQWLSSGAPNVLYNPQSGQLYNPDQPNIPYSLLRGSGAGGPTADDLGRIQMIQQMIAAGQKQQQQQQAGQTTTQTAPSYWGAAAPQINMGGAWQPSGGTQAGSTTGAPGAPGVPGATGVQGGGGGGTSMATTTAEQIPTSVSIPEWQQWYGRNVGKTMLVNGQPVTIGTDISPDQLLSAFQSNSVGWGAAPGPQQPAQAIGGPGQPQPESVALQQMAQIDPTSEALRQALGQSYLTNLAGRPSAPAAGDVQSYLDLYKQIDPQGYAQRVALAGGMDQFVQNAQAQAALGSQLDPGTIREVEQGTRNAQIARGNVYGTPQLVEETMARGSAGEQRMLQRQQMLQSALGQQQSYLGSGLGLGDVANTLYNQGYNRFLQGQGAALGYLGSGQTPYQAGASYYDRAQQQAAMAAQGGPQYNPSSLGPQYTGAGTPSFPQYGLEMSQLAGNWYNNINNTNLQAYNLQQAYSGQKGNYGALGSGIGTALGSIVGSVVPGVGTAIGGALGGAVGGAAGGSFSR